VRNDRPSALGRKDGELTRNEALAHARLIVNATDLLVSADLEKGFGDAPEVVAETIRLAAAAGLVGCTSLYRAAMTGFLDAANEVSGQGQFSFLGKPEVTARASLPESIPVCPSIKTWAHVTRIGVCHRRSELIQRVRRVYRECSFHLRKVHFGLLAFQDNSLSETGSPIGESYKSPLKR